MTWISDVSSLQDSSLMSDISVVDVYTQRNVSFHPVSITSASLICLDV